MWCKTTWLFWFIWCGWSKRWWTTPPCIWRNMWVVQTKVVSLKRIIDTDVFSFNFSCMSSSQLWWRASSVSSCVCGRMSTTTGPCATLLHASWPRAVKPSVPQPTTSSPVLPRLLRRWALCDVWNLNKNVTGVVLFKMKKWNFTLVEFRCGLSIILPPFLQSLLDDKTQWTTRYGCIAGLAELGPDVSLVLSFISCVNSVFTKLLLLCLYRWLRRWSSLGFL